MRSSFTIDTELGGWNMPNANTQLGPLRADNSKLIEAIRGFEMMLDDMVIDAARQMPLTKGDKEDYRQQLTDYVRERIHSQLSLVRKYTGMKARQGYKKNTPEIGAASTAVFRRSYQDVVGGNINISGNNKRMSRGRRPWKGGHQRDWSPDTERINKYFGLDRAFILRILESGRDGFMAESYTGKKGRGSRATWGRRGAMAARGFFSEMEGAMNTSADIVARSVDRYIERKFR